MIDPDLRKIIEPELLAGEELLWAEKTSLDKRQKWIGKQLSGDKIRFFLAALLVVICFIFPIMALIEKAFGLSEACLFFGGFLFAWSAWRFLQAFTKPELYENARPFFGYVLTNQRIFYVKLDKSVSDSNFENLKHVSIGSGRCLTKHLALWPANEKSWSRYRVFFLENHKRSQTELQTLVKGK